MAGFAGFQLDSHLLPICDVDPQVDVPKAPWSNLSEKGQKSEYILKEDLCTWQGGICRPPQTRFWMWMMLLPSWRSWRPPRLAPNQTVGFFLQINAIFHLTFDTISGVRLTYHTTHSSTNASTLPRIVTTHYINITRGTTSSARVTSVKSAQGIGTVTGTYRSNLWYTWVR